MYAQTDVKPSKEAQPEKFVLNMREADIRGFIQWTADRTQRNIIIHRNVRGNVTVISSQAVTPEEAYELFLTVLELNGFSAVDIGSAIKVIPAAEAKSSDIPFFGNHTNRGDIVIAIIHVQHADASILVGTLKPLMPAVAFLSAFANTNALIVADSAASIEKIRHLIRILDVDDNKIDLEIIPVTHASAQDIVTTLTTVVQALSGGASAQRPDDKVTFVVDKRSNSILVTGVVKKRQQMKMLIAKLDTPLEGDGNTQVIYLNYIEASEIVPILKSVGDSVLKDNKTDDRTSFSIESSETTNALIISAPPALLNSLRSIITQLDIQRAQVLIEAVIVQVNGDASDDFGVVWGGSDLYEENRTGGWAP